MMHGTIIGEVQIFCSIIISDKRFIELEIAASLQAYTKQHFSKQHTDPFLKQLCNK